MSKNCVMCNKKIGLFEKMYEDKRMRKKLAEETNTIES